MIFPLRPSMEVIEGWAISLYAIGPELPTITRGAPCEAAAMVEDPEAAIRWTLPPRRALTDVDPDPI
jgi:hypothetical protein